MEDSKKFKKNAILDAAYKLFIENGYENTKIIDIAMESNIGKGTVYEYFKSKDSLFCELFKTRVVDNYMEVTQSLSKDISCTDNLKLAIKYELENKKAFGIATNVTQFLFHKNTASQNKEFMFAMHDLMIFKFKIIYQIISSGMDSGEFKTADPYLTTIALIGAINFYMGFSCEVVPMIPQMEKIRKNPWDIEEFFNLIFNGILA